MAFTHCGSKQAAKEQTIFGIVRLKSTDKVVYLSCVFEKNLKKHNMHFYKCCILLLIFLMNQSNGFKYKNRYPVPPPPQIPFPSELDPIEEYRFTQKLDHFNKSVTATWRQVGNKME